MNVNEEQLEDFSWDDNSFFGEAATEEPAPLETEPGVEKIDDKSNKDDDAEPDDKKEGKEEEKEEVTFFGEDEVEEDEPKKKQEIVVGDSMGTFNYLVNKGIIDYDSEEDGEIDSEKASELISDAFDNGIEERVKDLFSGLPEDVRDLNKFVINGGNFEDYLKHYRKSASVGISSDMDLSDETNQEFVARKMLAEEGYDDDYINTQMKFLKDNDKLGTFSKQKFDVWKKKDDVLKENMKREAEQKKIQAKERMKETKRKVADLLKSDNLDLNGLSVTESDAKLLPDYMVEKTVRLENGQSISRMQRDFYKALQDDKKAVMLAKLLKTDFDFSGLAKKVETKVVKEVRENVRRSKTNTPKGSTNQGSQKVKRLADYFN